MHITSNSPRFDLFLLTVSFSLLPPILYEWCEPQTHPAQVCCVKGTMISRISITQGSTAPASLTPPSTPTAVAKESSTSSTAATNQSSRMS